MLKTLVLLCAASQLVCIGTASAAQIRVDGSFAHYEFPLPEPQRTALGQPSFVIMAGAPDRVKVTRRHLGTRSIATGIGDDRNCDSYAAPVPIINGNDPYRLDGDNDGIGCE